MYTPRTDSNKPHRPAKLPLLVAGSLILAAFAYAGRHGSTGLTGTLPAQTSPTRGIFSYEAKQILLMRRAGLTGDRSQVQAMIEVVTGPSHPHIVVVETALSALARLGAVEALPAFDYAAQSGSVEPGYLKVMRQRLVAEDLANNTPAGAKRAMAKVNSLYRGLSLSPARMSAASPAASLSTLASPVTSDMFAAREIADMVYRGNYADYASLDAVKQVTGTSDYPCALKMRLAPLSRSARVQALVDDLAHSRVMAVKQWYELQLASDEGTLASQAAAVKLQDMDKHRDEYPREGFDAIFSLLGGAGDATQAALVEHYTHDQDGYVAYFANSVYAETKAGHHAIFAPDY